MEIYIYYIILLYNNIFIYNIYNIYIVISPSLNIATNNRVKIHNMFIIYVCSYGDFRSSNFACMEEVGTR